MYLVDVHGINNNLKNFLSMMHLCHVHLINRTKHVLTKLPMDIHS